MSDLISRHAVIDEIEYELEMIDSALDSITLDFNARERLRQRKGEAREILNSIQQLPSAEPEIILCKDCRKLYQKADRTWIPKEDKCPLLHYRGEAQGHEFDYQFCAFAERKEE